MNINEMKSSAEMGGQLGSDIRLNLEKVQSCIDAACRASDRDDNEVTLVAVTKKQTPASIQQIVRLGVVNLGENYLQEAVEKQAILDDSDLIWHFIGQIQSNKCSMIAGHFSWVHSVSSTKVVRGLGRARISSASALNVCIQVNLCQDAKKSGVSPEELSDIIAAIESEPMLDLRGLMLIPPQGLSQVELSSVFKQMFELKCQLVQQGCEMDTLSMGMSQDYALAINCGSTTVRVGQAIFGERN